jgi:hypothetical protein
VALGVLAMATSRRGAFAACLVLLGVSVLAGWKRRRAVAVFGAPRSFVG